MIPRLSEAEEALPVGETHASGSAWSRVSIEPNGEEYLVTINGAVFVALSQAQAQAIAGRTRAGVVSPSVASTPP